jgi:hypothetical protein
VAVPLRLVAVFWLRWFKPVLQAGLPQMPTNRGLCGLGFVNEAYRRITDISHLDFRVAARFTGQNARKRFLREWSYSDCGFIASS